MAARYTKQTPPEIKAWLASHVLAFPADWTLDEVAKESRTRFLAGRWANVVEASHSVTHWGAHKLASSRDVSPEHWEWLAGAGPFQPRDYYSRLMRILEPACGEGVAWRSSDAAKTEQLKQLEKTVEELLRLLETERRLDIDFREMAGHRPEMQPLVDRAFEITQRRNEEFRQWAKNRAATNEEPPRAEFPGFLGGPRLSDYLGALLAKLRGDSRLAFPSLRALLPESELGDSDEAEDEADDDEEWDLDPSEIAALLGFAVNGPRDTALLRDGGDFGKYPERHDALMSAVIRAFPEPLFDRLVEPPKAPPASLIEAACIAWFGKAPTQKEINARIRAARERLEPAMRQRIASAAKDTERRERWMREGLSPDEIARRLLQSGLGDE